MNNTIDLREAIAACAQKCGADAVGFGSVSRVNDPAIAAIFPEAKTVIALLFRVLRGSYRGIEEGTTYYQYSTTGVETNEETIMPEALLRVCSVIEDAGYWGIPHRRIQQLRPERTQPNPEMLHHTWYEAGQNEAQLDFPRAAVACGLGEIGLSGALLTDAFGPFVRYAFVLTDAELEETPLAEPHLCDKCGKCRAACPGKAIDENGVLNRVQCSVYYRGANSSTNPYMPVDAYGDLPNRDAILSGTATPDFEEAQRILAETVFYPGIKRGYAASICGRACDRACYVHLEEKGVLTKRFEQPFRKRPVWKLSDIQHPKD